MPMNGKHILYTASSDAHLKSFHLPYLHLLTRLGYDVTAAAAGSGYELQGICRYISVPFTKSFVSPRNLSATFRLAELIRRERFDLVLTHTSLAAFFTRLALILAGKKNTRVVNTVHGYLFDDQTPAVKRTVLLWAEKLTSRVTDDIVTMNRTDTVIAQHFRLCRGQVFQVNGIGADFARFHPACGAEKTDARRALEIPEDAFVLVYAAEFSSRKNQSMLIESMPELPARVWLLLPGRGELLKGCRALADRLHVSDRTVFPGYRDDIAGCYHAADACVSSSRSEGLPFNVLEAMSCGLPAIVSAVKGHEELVSSGTNGYLFPFGDRKTFVASVGKLLSDTAAATRMGFAARASTERYGIDEVMPVVISCYLADTDESNRPGKTV